MESKKHNTVERSFVEAKYRSMVNITSETIWIRAILKEMGVDNIKPTLMYYNNKVTLQIAANLVFHECERTKHIEIDCT